MCDRTVGRHDQIQMPNYGGCIDESASGRVKIISEVYQSKIRAFAFDLLKTVDPLQAE
jgi:hypothetical protein